MIIQYTILIMMSKGYPNMQPGSDAMPLNTYCEKQLLGLPGDDIQSYVCAYYCNCLYLIECYGAEPQKQIKMHVFSDKEKQWKSYQTFFQKNVNRINPYFPKLGASSALVAGNLYIYGGRDAKGKVDNRLCSLDLSKKMWKVDIDSPSTNTVPIMPQGRASSRLLAFKQDYLLLYGGLVQNMDNSNNLCMWIFDIGQSCWHRTPTLTVPGFISTSVCIDNDKLYIFGSRILAGPNNMLYNQSNLIQITIERCLEEFKSPLTLSTQQVFNSSEQQPKVLVNPSSRYQIFRYDSKLLMLLQMVGRQAKMSTQVTRIWFYDAMTHQWQQTQIQLNMHPDQVVVANSTVCYCLQYSANNQVMLKLQIPEEEIKALKSYIRYKQWKKCEICYETYINKNTLMEPAFKLSKQLLDSLTEKIKFPFAAFGLFAESAISHSATYINFHYDIYKQSPIIKIQDDNRSNFTNDELEQIIVNFQAEINLNFGSVDKRVRTIMAKDFMKKEFGTNLKIAAMRLGSQLLYVSLTPNYQTRVAYLYLQNDEYVCYFYVFNEKTNKILDDYSLEAKLFVQSKYRDLIKQALHEIVSHNKFGAHKSTAYIMGLRTVINEQGVRVPQIEPIVTSDQKDLLYTSYNPSTYKAYLDFGCKINESIDVSLSTYLSLLFLKNQNMKISVQLFKFERKLIRREESYENVDRNAWSKFVSTIDGSIKSYDLKLIDLMVNNKLNKKLGLFHNGILMYHKNRLVKRFDCELGELLNHMEFCQQLSYGYFNVFGRIELPDAIEPNQQKTDFVSEAMLQKLYSRLKAIHQICKKNAQTQKQQIRGQGKERNKQKVQQHEVRHAPMKKVKRNHEDQSYSVD